MRARDARSSAWFNHTCLRAPAHGHKYDLSFSKPNGKQGRGGHAPLPLPGQFPPQGKYPPQGGKNISRAVSYTKKDRSRSFADLFCLFLLYIVVLNSIHLILHGSIQPYLHVFRQFDLTACFHVFYSLMCPLSLITSITSSTYFSQISSDSASTMTRITGSVPLSRTRILPVSPSSSATCETAA